MIGYTRKVGLRKPELLQCLDCWIRLVECEHQDVALAEIRARRDHKSLLSEAMSRPIDHAVIRGDYHKPLIEMQRRVNRITWLMKVGATAFNHRPSCSHCACYMHAECCWCDDGQVHREADTCPRYEVDPATCPHCCCTYTTECCYCDGSRTPLEDS